jgi:hypothetical protein
LRNLPLLFFSYAVGVTPHPIRRNGPSPDKHSPENPLVWCRDAGVWLHGKENGDQAACNHFNPLGEQSPQVNQYCLHDR